MKTSSIKSAKTKKGGAGVDDNSRARRDRNKLDGSEIDDVEVDGNKVGNDEVEKKGQKTSKSKNLSKSKKRVGSDFFTFGARLAFTKLRQTFIKAPIFYHFDPKYHIRIETDASSYAIGGGLNQLTLDDLG